MGQMYMNSQLCYLNERLQKRFQAVLADWQANNGTARLWQKDSTLWTGNGESEWLGWLDIVETQLPRVRELNKYRSEFAVGGFSHALLLGMGGSSLCPEVLAKSFGPQKGYPELLVLDSVDPQQIRAFEKRIDLKQTLFIVSSKSGSTLEPNCLMDYFLERVKKELGEKEAVHRFVAITDPGSSLELKAQQLGFRRIFHGVKSIGGRFSALSDFGMVPATIMGINVEEFIRVTHPMVVACRRNSIEDNPGIQLGLVLGAAYLEGFDKLTVICSPPIRYFGAWLEQLIAESTGKGGKAIIPVVNEALQPAEYYNHDRLFVQLRFIPAPDPEHDAQVQTLIKAGHPVVVIDVRSLPHIGQEFFRWEIATAVAGSIMGLNPFDQPDVEASKAAARKITAEFERTGNIQTGTPDEQFGNLKVYIAPHLAPVLGPAFKNSLTNGLQHFLGLLNPKDFFALLAFVEMNPDTETALQQIRHLVLQRKKVATCLGFGPRFLHSTGQAYKGGPNAGVFLQITYTPSIDLPIPGKKFTFAAVELAQAQGDFQVMAERTRRILRIHVEGDLLAGLRELTHAVKIATT